MKVRLNIDQIAVLMHANLAMSFKDALNVLTHLYSGFADAETIFSPDELKVIAKMLPTISRLIAERFVQNDQAVSLLTVEDTIPFKPGGTEHPIETMKPSATRSVDELRFNLFLGMVVRVFHGKEVYGHVRKWIQTVLKLSRDHGMNADEFVKMPDVKDEIVRGMFTKDEYLTLRNSHANMGGQLALDPRMQEILIQQLVKGTGISLDEARAELQSHKAEMEQSISTMTKTVHAYNQKEADRIFDFKVDAPN